jgi:hypothetical protein
MYFKNGYSASESVLLHPCCIFKTPGVLFKNTFAWTSSQTNEVRISGGGAWPWYFLKTPDDSQMQPRWRTSAQNAL